MDFNHPSIKLAEDIAKKYRALRDSYLYRSGQEEYNNHKYFADALVASLIGNSTNQVEKILREHPDYVNIKDKIGSNGLFESLFTNSHSI